MSPARELKEQRNMWRWNRVQRHNLVVFFFLIHIGGELFIFNSHFVGKVALELGPAPHVRFFLIHVGRGRPFGPLADMLHFLEFAGK